MIEKKDWIKVKENTEKEINNIKKSYAMQLPQMEAMLIFLNTKIAEFPDDDPMPEEVKDIVKDVSK